MVEREENAQVVPLAQLQSIRQAIPVLEDVRTLRDPEASLRLVVWVAVLVYHSWM